MCGRYALTSEPHLIAALFGLDGVPEIAPRYNIAPTQRAPVVRAVDSAEATRDDTEERSDQPAPRRLDLLSWGLLPPRDRDAKAAFRGINARAETLSSRPLLALQHQSHPHDEAGEKSGLGLPWNRSLEGAHAQHVVPAAQAGPACRVSTGHQTNT